MLDGWLNGQTLEIGKVAFSIGWQISIPPFGSVERTMVIAFGESKREVIHRLGRNLADSFESHHERHRAEWEEWLKRVKVSFLNSLGKARQVSFRSSVVDDEADLGQRDGSTCGGSRV